MWGQGKLHLSASRRDAISNILMKTQSYVKLERFVFLVFLVFKKYCCFPLLSLFSNNLFFLSFLSSKKMFSCLPTPLQRQNFCFIAPLHLPMKNRGRRASLQSSVGQWFVYHENSSFSPQKICRLDSGGW